jgi:hypothetical protein
MIYKHALGRRCCEILLPFSFRWQPNIATTQKSTSSPADGVSTSLLHPPLPALQPPSRAGSFPALLQLDLVPLSSRIKPLLEMCLEALDHLFFNVFDVGEPVPTSDIAVFTVTLKLQNEFFHDCAPNFCTGSLNRRPLLRETFSCST